MAQCTTILNWTLVLSETMPMLGCGSTIGCLKWLPWQPFSRLGWMYLWEDGCFLFDYVRFLYIQFPFKFNISMIYGNTNIFCFWFCLLYSKNSIYLFNYRIQISIMVLLILFFDRTYLKEINHFLLIVIAYAYISLPRSRRCFESKLFLQTILTL